MEQTMMVTTLITLLDDNGHAAIVSVGKIECIRRRGGVGGAGILGSTVVLPHTIVHVKESVEQIEEILTQIWRSSKEVS